jgi:hypothetical protein
MLQYELLVKLIVKLDAPEFDMYWDAVAQEWDGEVVSL